MGLVSLQEEEEAPDLPLLLCEDRARWQLSASQEKGPEHAGTLVLDFAASKMMKNKCLWFKPPTLPSL